MASNSRIKGITIELEGKTTGLDKALKDVTSKSMDLQNELKDVERLLKFDPGNVEALAQKQKILSQQLENTTEKLNRLKSAQEEVEKQFQNGDIGEKQYRAFRREIEYTEKSVKDLESKISQLDGNEVKELKKDFNKVKESSDEAKESVKELGNDLLELAAGAAAVEGIGGVIEKALDISSTNTKIELTFDIPEESKQSVKESINSVRAYGIDAEEALSGVRKQWALNKNASDESNASVVKSAGAIVAAYNEIDFTELIQESNELSKNLNISNEDALAMINSLLKVGFPADQLDIITEYGSQLARAGYNAEEIQAIMAAGVNTGSWNIDVLLDGLKEGRIVLTEFGQGVDDETAKLFEKIGISKTQLESWGKSIAAGGEEGKAAFQKVAEALSGVEDKTLQNQLGVIIAGTLWEENGTKIADTILGVNDNLTTTNENQEELNKLVLGLDSDPAKSMQQAILDLQTALEPLLSFIADIISKIAKWAQDNPTLAATIIAIITALSILLGIFMALSPIISAIAGLATALGISVGAIAAPVLIVIGVITALIAIGVALYKNWDEIKAKCSEIWGSIKEYFSQTWENIKTTFSNSLSNIISSVKEKFNNIKQSVSEKMGEVKNSISNIWDNVMSFFKNINLFDIGKNIIQGLINGIKNMATKVVDSVKGVVNGAIEGAKNLLGIHSPSRVFMEFGEYSGEGFINGINEMKDSVAKAGQSMANASLPNIKAPNLRNSFDDKEIILYTTNNSYLDSKLIANETTKQVVKNIGKSTNNYRVGKGGLGFA